MGSLFGGKKAPTPTDPTKVIAAQSGAIDDSIERQQTANRVNQRNAFGSESAWTYQGIDPQTGQPRYSQSTSFGAIPQEYAEGLAGLGRQYMQGAGELVGNRPDLSSQAAFDQADAFWRQREEPRMQSQRDAEMNRLRNMGFEENSEGFRNAMDSVSRQQSDARAGFLNSAQNQFFNQGLNNRAQQVGEFQSLLAPGVQFGNAALGTGFQGVPGINVGTVDAQGAYNTYDNQKMLAYQAQQAQQNAMLGGLAGLGGSIIGGPIGGYLGKNMFGGGAAGGGGMFG